jgi:hypothetical protein
MMVSLPIEPGSTHAGFHLEAEPYSREVSICLGDQAMAIVRSDELLKAVKAVVSYQEKVTQEDER